MHLKTPTFGLLLVSRAPTPSPARASVHAKFTEAALAAAFATKNQGENEGAAQRETGKGKLTLEEQEERVIAAIRAGLHAGAELKIGKVATSLGDFGKACGGVAQTWLTPPRLENCAFFWTGGWTLFTRDLKRGRLGLRDLKPSLWFGLLAINTFPYTPLLVPLVSKAVNSTDAAFVPAPFQASRLAALKRLLRDPGIDANLTLDEGVRFFSDGTRMLLRDALRNQLGSYGDSASSFGWFALLCASTFPLTPLLIPIIDKRRPDGLQSDYVPSAYRAHRLAAFGRYRALATTARTRATPIETIHAAAAAEGELLATRPAPAELLAAIVALDTRSAGRERFLEELAGGGPPGQRWRLLYTAGADAVSAARKAPPLACRAASSASWQDGLSEAVLPWTKLKHGLYVDQLVTAIQRFDSSTFENENGIFGVLGSDWIRLTVHGPFKWPQPEKRAICAFQPTVMKLALGPLAWEFPLTAETAAAASTPTFDEQPVTKLPFFKFVLVDELVAVAQGRSGGVALWVRMK